MNNFWFLLKGASYSGLTTNGHLHSHQRMACSLTAPEKKKTSQNQKEKKLVSNSYDKVMFGHFLGRGASIHVAVAWKETPP